MKLCDFGYSKVCGLKSLWEFSLVQKLLIVDSTFYVAHKEFEDCKRLY